MANALKWARWAIGRESAEDVIADNEKQIALLRQEYDDQERMVEQLTANAVRLNNGGQRAAARTALAHKKEAEIAMNQTAGKMATLQAQTNNLRGLDSNVKMHASVKRGNAVTQRVGASITVDQVDETMDKALELKDAHKDVAEALAGKDYLEPFDEDEADAELAALCGDPANQVYVRPGPAGAIAPIPDYAELARQRAEEARQEAALIERLQQMPPVPKASVGQVKYQPIPSTYQQQQPLPPSPAANNILHYHGGGGGQK